MSVTQGTIKNNQESICVDGDPRGWPQVSGNPALHEQPINLRNKEYIGSWKWPLNDGGGVTHIRQEASHPHPASASKPLYPRGNQMCNEGEEQ